MAIPAGWTTSQVRRVARRMLPARRAAAFSLIEVMMAIIILGLGLVMVATMFPVAWTRARALTEHTVQRAVDDATETTVRSVLRAGGRDFFTSTPSFKSDLLYDLSASRGERILALPDTRVHALNLENIQLPAPNQPAVWTFVSEDPHLLEERHCLHEWEDPAFTDPDEIYTEWRARSYYSPRVRFRQRVYPPISDRPAVNADGNTFDPAANAQWARQASERGYAWSVLYRLRNGVGSTSFTINDFNNVPQTVPLLNPHMCVVDPSNPDMRPYFSAAAGSLGISVDKVLAAAEGEIEADTAFDQSRMVDLYVFTLRRPQSTHRYARQDPAHVPDALGDLAAAVVPQALGPETDVMLPVPWRVQVYFPFTATVMQDISTYVESGLPTEIEVNTTNCTTSPMVVQMFAKGAYFVDEISGELYRVTRQRVKTDAAGTPTEAYVTLDREVVPADLNLLETEYPICENCGETELVPRELVRTVWVFPPPVDVRADSGDAITFVGPSPVVGVDILTMNVAP